MITNFYNRNKEIVEMRNKGHKLREIGKVYGLTPQRIREICMSFHRMKEYQGEPHDTPYFDLRREINKACKALHKEHLEKRTYFALRRNHVMSLDDLKSLDYDGLKRLKHIGDECLSILLEVRGECQLPII